MHWMNFLQCFVSPLKEQISTSKVLFRRRYLCKNCSRDRFGANAFGQTREQKDLFCRVDGVDCNTSEVYLFPDMISDGRTDGPNVPFRVVWCRTWIAQTKETLTHSSDMGDSTTLWQGYPPQLIPQVRWFRFRLSEILIQHARQVLTGERRMLDG